MNVLRIAMNWNVILTYFAIKLSTNKTQQTQIHYSNPQVSVQNCICSNVQKKAIAFQKKVFQGSSRYGWIEKW